MPLVLKASVCQSQIRLIPSRTRMRLCPMARLSPPEFISPALKTQAGLHQRPRFYDILFDAGLRGQMGEFGDYFKNWNWESGFRYSRNEEDTVTDGVVSAAA